MDSGIIPADDITCLVGKNEAGKTALLQALCRLNPVLANEANFTVTNDYPRMEVEDYRHDVESGKRTHSVPIEASYALGAEEIEEIKGLFGPECLQPEPELIISKDYANKAAIKLAVNLDKSLSHLIDTQTCPSSSVPIYMGLILTLAA